MLAHLGDYFIYTATACALFSAILYLMAWRGREGVLDKARHFFRFATAFVVAATALLLYMILTHDFSVIYVFQYSSSDLPLYYLISTLWGGQEGTFLLWLSLAGVMGLVMMRTARQFEKGNMFWLNLFLLSILIILIKKSPFELMPVFRTEGSGLNPLLVNFWMTIHPPLMFVGFAAAAMPFCFAMTALVERKYNDWAEAARRWTVFAWAVLGLALVMGGYWAYETLGWGGYWAWDPVENASLIPWIFLTAQIHTLYVKRQRRGLMRFSLAIVLLSFWSVLYGTFLTRSGVLADFSVHSFVDLGLNMYLVAGLTVFFVGGAFLMIFRWRDIKPEPSFSAVNSRTYLTALGIVILFIGAWLVLLGTSAPLLTRVMENPSAVDLSYYFTTMVPIAVLTLLLMAIMPIFKWGQGVQSPRLGIVTAAVFTVTVLILLVAGITSQIIYLAFFGCAVAALVSNGYVLLKKLFAGRLHPAYLAHIGLIIGFIGAGGSSGFETKETVSLPMTDTVQAQGYDLTFTGMVETQAGFDCHVDVERGGTHFIAVLPHEFPKNSEGVMRKPHVKSYLLDDLYLSPIALEQPRATDPGELYLTKGTTATLDKYDITFIDFETGGGHGEGGSAMSAAALLEIAYDGQVESARPQLRVVGEGIEPQQASFDSNRGSVQIVGVRPEEGGVVLKFSGDFVPEGHSVASTLVVEISQKPLIQLFWLGTILVFVSGLIIVFRRRKGPGEIAHTRQAEERTVAASGRTA